MLINIFLAFIEGFALIISPCILPILPIILSGSLSGSRKRPYGIILGFIITFSIITLFTKAIVNTLHIDPIWLRDFSFVLLIVLGLIMISSTLTEKFAALTNRLANVGSSGKHRHDADTFLGGLLFGGLVGIIWTPCAGPILAAVIVQSVLQSTTLQSIFTVLAFAIGAALPMLIIALMGREFINHFNFLKTHSRLLRQILGVIIILSVILLWSGWSSITEESKPASEASVVSENKLIDPVLIAYPAPAIEGIADWINSPPLTLAQLKGKVVLIDFWTYSCINCIRTLPYLKAWYDKYHSKGLEIIGVHAPEFQFEHDLGNVTKAVEKFGIRYPVALDNDFVTWRNYRNRYWPAHYLIDQSGDVVYEHFGEGAYDVTENNIRFLLGLNAAPMQAETSSFSSRQTPETYLGYARSERFVNAESIVKDKVAFYSLATNLEENAWGLQGNWIIYPEKIVAASASATLSLHFYARRVYAVMGAEQGSIKVKVLVNGGKTDHDEVTDVVKGELTVTGNQLYTLVDLPAESDAILEIVAETPGLEIYSFTFG